MSVPADASLASWASSTPPALVDLESEESLPALAEMSALAPPSVLECATVEAALDVPADYCAATGSPWAADVVARCDMPRISHARALLWLTRGRGRAAARGLGDGHIGPMPDVVAPDRHSSPPLAGAARATLWLSLHALALAPASHGTPPSPPARRIDRPPRS
jgi:hypothetical protein